MTTVYGVTFVGARAQIEKQLRERGDLNRNQLWTTSTYLARAVRRLMLLFFFDIVHLTL